MVALVVVDMLMDVAGMAEITVVVLSTLLNMSDKESSIDIVLIVFEPNVVVVDDANDSGVLLMLLLLLVTVGVGGVSVKFSNSDRFVADDDVDEEVLELFDFGGFMAAL